MTGRYISKQQVELYMNYRNTPHLTQEACAAKAGICQRSAYTIEQNQHHTQRAKHRRTYKTRASLIDAVWKDELVHMLKENPDLQPKTLLIYLQRKYQDKTGEPIYGQTVLRTLQRRVAHWKAKHGKPKAVMFPQQHLPGQQGLSDFTHMDRSEILINGDVFPHMLYQFRLVYSKWSYVKVIQTGESFQALSEGLQEALAYLGGSPREHRTDSLSAAYKNRNGETKDDLTQQYQALCELYHMEPTRNNKGEKHENGSVESSHGHIKNRIHQELLLRGSNHFASVAEYEKWVQDIVLNSNKRNSKNFVFEKQSLQPLPERKAMDYEVLSKKISSLSILLFRGITYSVPSQLSGHTLTLHVYQNHIEGYLGGSQVLSLPRQYQRKNKTRYVINYCHIIHALIKKPRAFRYCLYRDEILPNAVYREIWHHIDSTFSTETAPKMMLRLLKLAADYQCEYALGEHVTGLIKKAVTLDIERIEQQFNGSNPPLPQVNCEQHRLIDYDDFIPIVSDNAGGLHYATA